MEAQVIEKGRVRRLFWMEVLSYAVMILTAALYTFAPCFKADIGEVSMSKWAPSFWEKWAEVNPQWETEGEDPKPAILPTEEGNTVVPFSLYDDIRLILSFDEDSYEDGSVFEDASHLMRVYISFLDLCSVLGMAGFVFLRMVPRITKCLALLQLNEAEDWHEAICEKKPVFTGVEWGGLVLSVLLTMIMQKVLPPEVITDITQTPTYMQHLCGVTTTGILMCGVALVAAILYITAINRKRKLALRVKKGTAVILDDE